MITRRSRLLASRTSRFMAVMPPTRHVLPDRVEVGAQPADHVVGLRAVRRGGRVACTTTLPSTTLGGAPGASPAYGSLTPSSRDSTSTTCWALASGAMTCTGLPAGREVLGQHLLAGDRLDLVEEDLGLGDPLGLQVGTKAAAAGSAAASAPRCGAGGRPPGGDPAPDPTGADLVLRVDVVHRGTEGQKMPRPNSSSTPGRKVSAAMSAPAIPGPDGTQARRCCRGRRAGGRAGRG